MQPLYNVTSGKSKVPHLFIFYTAKSISAAANNSATSVVADTLDNKELLSSMCYLPYPQSPWHTFLLIESIQNICQTYLYLANIESLY